MNPLEIIEKYYEKGGDAYHILVDHSVSVTELALKMAKNRMDLNPDLTFISEAAMLHDIGIFKTSASVLHCFGENPYICHGYLGADILRAEGYPLHALVCERHTGAGLSLAHIIKENLPLPHREMLPLSIEEQVVCFADKFFSKTHLGEEYSVEKARTKLLKFGDETIARFDAWCEMFL
ncbi:MAG: HDIG domain-containing protein [Paludibacteraceae bacterium]|nr:HDIG domain-containing protein [Paludibacteraceae bacterium]